ncbi:glycosyltransferase [Actinomyces respiraculi]|uniref:Glycosyltransferase n=2 Tax=Actinomycetaceae TaxID=2049 RepID=A0A7T0LNJ2_9ACTO|nr:glycosyltransferase [Actinomyces respiraculi]
MATRIHLPEAAAAALRLDGVERALAGHHVPVRVLTTTPPASAPEPTDPQGVSVSRWPALRDASGYLRGYLPYVSFDVPLMGRFFAQPRPDAVLVEPPPTTGVVMRLACALRRVPYVWYAPDVWSTAAQSTGAPRLVLEALRRMESFAVRGAARVVAINEEVAEHVRALGGREVRVVPNGVDTSVFDPTGPVPDAEARRRIGLTGPYAVYAGTLSEWQDAGVFVRALEGLRATRPDAQILFLGQGSDWETVAQDASRLPAGADGAPAVVMHPPLPPAEAAAWQRGAVCALVSIKPGLGYDFAYPTKVLAALGCGTPVLYAGHGPVGEDVERDDLGIVSDHDPQAVAAAMEAAFAADAALTDRQRRQRAERLHAWVRTHRSLEATGQAVARLMREVVIERRGGATARAAREKW